MDECPVNKFSKSGGFPRRGIVKGGCINTTRESKEVGNNEKEESSGGAGEAAAFLPVLVRLISAC
jgi:hypothetical protein